MNNNNHNSFCGFAEDAVAYLYGEIDETQKAKFEKHLSLCSHCEEEITAFATVRSSVLNWKSEEFDILASPVIDIPFGQMPKTVENFEISRFWLESLLELFSFSPVKVAAACAFLVVGFSLMFFVFDFSAGNEFADLKNNNSFVIEVEQPTENIVEPEIQTPAVEKIAERETNAKISNVENKSEEVFVQAKSPKKVSPSPAEIVKTQNTPNRLSNSPAVKNPKNTLIKQNEIEARIQQAPRLNNLPEEGEDRSLRLADLLADLDTE
ncbi:MAG TPA: zf-HC2 domain-containing protein [Pyrinomonadaceae bacterium]|nr:zf-HC2 domain-containing protein [Pyrinomonadaceae bacterium]